MWKAFFKLVFGELSSHSTKVRGYILHIIECDSLFESIGDVGFRDRLDVLHDYMFSIRSTVVLVSHTPIGSSLNYRDNLPIEWAAHG